ncbi:hypothetical protein B0H13DRAFT_1971212 [Mycena leptocephala]|nr:hypothetical protein B0H13DRAFT_1971212 [Mycena leptocephala]
MTSASSRTSTTTPTNKLPASADQHPPSTPTRSARDSLQARDTLHAAYAIAMPSPVRKTASRMALAAENDQLRTLLKAAGIELDANYAQMLHARKNKPKRTYTTGKARLMTSDEMAQALLEELQKKQMADLHSELKKTFFPDIKKAISDAEKAEQAKEKAAKKATKKAEQEARAAEKAVEKARKAVEKEAARAAKAAAKARGRGRGRPRGTRRAGAVGGGGRGRGKARDSSEEEISDPESSSDEETDLDRDDPADGANPSPSTTDVESSEEENNLDGPVVSSNPSPSAANAPLATQDESDDDDDSDQEETEIRSFNGHRWEKRRNLEFQVVWTDGDVTWEPLSNVNDCLAMEQYLAHHDLDDPLLGLQPVR